MRIENVVQIVPAETKVSFGSCNMHTNAQPELSCQLITDSLSSSTTLEVLGFFKWSQSPW